MEKMAFLFLLLISSLTSPTAGQVYSTVPPKKYCSPGDECWPTQAQVDTLKQGLGADQPLYQDGDTNYTHYQSINWNHRYQRSPGFIALVKNVAGIQRCITFVKTHNLQLSIVSSGHSFIGRNTEDESFQINVSQMKEATVDLNCPEHEHGCLTAEAGCIWLQLYELVDRYDRVVVGGSQPTVSVSGYTMGGGHSPFSRLHGIAVDNVLEIKMVSPEGLLVTVNSTGYLTKQANGQNIFTEDPDLFWALRGGGGSTFGVAVQFKMKLHPAPIGGVATIGCSFPAFYFTATYFQDFLTWFPSKAATFPDRVGGYVVVGGWYLTSYVLVSLVHMGNMSAAEPIFSDFNSTLRFGDWYPCTKQSHSSFLEYAKNITETPGSLLISNGLVQYNKIQDEKNLGGFVKTLIDPLYNAVVTPNGGDLFYTFTLLGGKSSRIASSETAVHPGFRTALFSLSMATAFTHTLPGDYDPTAIRLIETSQGLQAYSSGQYFNECLENQTNWRDVYWSDFLKLYNIKARWDPDNVFYCRQCVNAEDSPSTPTGSSSAAAFNLLLIISSCLLGVLINF